MNDKRTLRIVLVGAGILLTIAVWIVTIRYNLQGGFRKKLNTATSVQASGQIDEIEEKIKLFKEKFKTNKGQIDQLLQK